MIFGSEQGLVVALEGHEGGQLDQGRSVHCIERFGLGVTYGTDAEGTYLLTASKGSSRQGDCQSGPQKEYLANFSAKIVEEIHHHTHQGDVVLFYTLEVEHKSVVHPLQVPAAEFDSGRWWVSRLGSSAVVAVGMTKPEHLKNAILEFSQPTKVDTFEMVGWVSINGQDLWLHSNGAIGPLGPSLSCPGDTAESGTPPITSPGSQRSGTNGPLGPRVRAKLPLALNRYELPVPDAKALLDSGEADLPCRYVLSEPHPALVVGFGAVFSSVLRSTELSVMFYGQTGCQKTSLALFLQQCFGKRFGRSSIPATWNATSNAIEAMAATVHDAILLIDDFVPTGTTADAAAKQRVAENFLRGRSNVNGRARCSSDGSLRQGRRPLATPICTGEDVPQGESLRARLVCCEMTKGCLDLELLTEHQQLANDGAYARLLAAFIQWLAGIRSYDRAYWDQQIQEWEAWLDAELRRFHGELHGRQLQMTIDLLVGWLMFLKFLEDTFPSTDRFKCYQSDNFFSMIFFRVNEVIEQHDVALKDDDPVYRSLTLLDSAFRSGAAHVRSTADGGRPDRLENPERWGYRSETYFVPSPASDRRSGDDDDSGEEGGQKVLPSFEEKVRYNPHGRHIGWLKSGALYLLPKEIFALLRRLSIESGYPLNLSELQLTRRLVNAGVLLRRDHKHITTRLTVSEEHGRVAVWHVSIDSFYAILNRHQPLKQVVCEGCVCDAMGWEPCDRDCPEYCPV